MDGTIWKNFDIKIEIDNQNKIPFQLLQNTKNCWRYTGFTVIGGRVGVAAKDLHVKYQLSSLYSFQDLSVHTNGQTGVQTDLASSTRLVIVIKNIYILLRARIAVLYLLHNFQRILFTLLLYK